MSPSCDHRNCATYVCNGPTETCQCTWGHSSRPMREHRRNSYRLNNKWETCSTWRKNRCVQAHVHVSCQTAKWTPSNPHLILGMIKDIEKHLIYWEPMWWFSLTTQIYSLEQHARSRYRHPECILRYFPGNIRIFFHNSSYLNVACKWHVKIFHKMYPFPVGKNPDLRSKWGDIPPTDKIFQEIFLKRWHASKEKNPGDIFKVRKNYLHWGSWNCAFRKPGSEIQAMSCSNTSGQTENVSTTYDKQTKSYL